MTDERMIRAALNVAVSEMQSVRCAAEKRGRLFGRVAIVGIRRRKRVVLGEEFVIQRAREFLGLTSSTSEPELRERLRADRALLEKIQSIINPTR